ncbi:MAG: peptide ABC transporter permease [Gammaproteobacteria bacterium CG_4_10_14_0_8_um_filter_38_16]|nr:MAG: peptide ABC transporter permease [Gammaproteobacteria bacterium CG_4_10_14_0_8_um_filter_38_16]PJA03140.1 MAG: peptide ABC transporter permease [Gammaproteobacteria bacterium CG_4_10_14_0_2_um_filter_38_22]PJB09699.1 MAG: peptide ABC transporter permease [Gammaproteobacteria bacterium CG_4_9_14_3_um_filter_38_9]
MTLALLPSDYIVWVLFFLFVIALFWIRTQPHYRAQWKQVFQKKIAMIAFVILGVFAIIGLLDSIHIQIMQHHLPQQKSILDLVLSLLNTQDEKTYTAPFAVALHPTPPHDIILRSMKGFLFGALSYAIVAGIWIYICRHKKNKLAIAWREAMMTIGIIWILICVLTMLAQNYHIFGTNKIGQDMFYETIKSVRTGLLIGTLTTLFMLPFALFFGTIAGYFGGFIDDVIQYLYTTLSSIPGVLLITAMILVMQVVISNHPALFPTIADRADARLLTLCFILGITSWASLCRLLRAETLKLREQDFVLAAIAMGAKKIPIIIRHILPNVMHIILITIVLDFSGLVLAEAVLSYVGVGVDPTTASWGNMINTSRLELAREPIVWWPLCAALVMMFFLVLSANLFSDAVRDAFDPRAGKT